jgi:hypothetical protein
MSPLHCSGESREGGLPAIDHETGRESNTKFVEDFGRRAYC